MSTHYFAFFALSFVSVISYTSEKLRPLSTSVPIKIYPSTKPINIPASPFLKKPRQLSSSENSPLPPLAINNDEVFNKEDYPYLLFPQDNENLPSPRYNSPNNNHSPLYFAKDEDPNAIQYLVFLQTMGLTPSSQKNTPNSGKAPR